MSDYNQITDFSAKDLLTTGDPNKLILGSDVDAELDAVSTAITSKYDSSDLASQAEAEAGTATAKLMTPQRVTQWAAALDVAYTDTPNTWTANQTTSTASASHAVDATSGNAHVYFNDNGTTRGLIYWNRAADALNIRQYDTDGSTVRAQLSMTEAGVSNFDTGTLQYGGVEVATVDTNWAAGDITSGTFADARIAQSNVTQHQAALSITESQITDLGTSALLTTDIGSTVQAYDADTAKYDAATANFTGTLQNGGSNVLVDSDLGVTVQAYDADTAKTDVANTWTANQTIATAGASLAVDAPSGNAHVYFQDGATTRSLVFWNRGTDTFEIRQYDTDGSTIRARFAMSETGYIDVPTGTLQYGGVEVATVDDVPDKISFRGDLTANHASLGASLYDFSSTNFSNFAEDFDNGGHFTPSTGKFQPTVAGYYQLNFSVYGTSITDGDTITAYIYKNTGYIAQDRGQADSSAVAAASCSTMIYLNGSTDYAIAKVQSTDTSWTLRTDVTQFSGHLVHT